MSLKKRKMRRIGHVSLMGEYKNTYSVLVGIPEENVPLEILNFNLDLPEIERVGF
jgi:hypothetical protein